MFVRTDFKPVADDQTKVTMFIDRPDMDESIDKSLMMRSLEETAKIRKELIETEA
jgi:hypothetical protein